MKGPHFTGCFEGCVKGPYLKGSSQGCFMGAFKASLNDIYIYIYIYIYILGLGLLGFRAGILYSLYRIYIGLNFSRYEPLSRARYIELLQLHGAYGARSRQRRRSRV